MKKAIFSAFLVALTLFTSGCLERNNLDNATIYTTVYPFQYFTEVLYGNHSKISSIYPDGADVTSYSLTDKQIKEYSKGDVFVYNGLTDEKQIAKDFTNNNRKIQIIDVAYGFKYKYSVYELWLSPNNALMLASNIKTNLETFIGSKLVNEEIEEKYRELEETLSLQDAELRNVARNALASGTNTLVVSSNGFKFLEDYGFQIISLEDNTSENSINLLKRNFSNDTYQYLFVFDVDSQNEYIDDLKNSGAEIVTVQTMTTLKAENRMENDNYLSIMQEFLDKIKNAVLK